MQIPLGYTMIILAKDAKNHRVFEGGFYMNQLNETDAEKILSAVQDRSVAGGI